MLYQISKGSLAVKLMLGSAGLLSATLAVAQEPQTNRPSRMLQAYASTYNVSSDEAARRIKIQNEVGELDAKLTEQEPGTFAGLYIEHKPAFRVVVKFKGDGAAILRKYTQDPIYVPVDASETYAGLRAIQDSLAATLRSLNLKAWTDLDIETGRVKLYVPDTTIVTAAVSAGTIKLSPLVDVLKAVSTSEQREAAIEGGRNINANNFLCTTGFTVRSTSVTQTSTSPRYILTAGHCDSPIKYGTVVLKEEGVKLDRTTAFDYKWLSTPGFDRLRNEIYDGIGPDYPITSVKPYASMSLQQIVCKFGASTAYTCGRIVSKDYKPLGSPNAFVRVHELNNGNMSLAGDSGGPYIDDYTNTAYGIHNDSAKNVNRDESAFMPVSYISASGLTVLVNP